MDKFDVALSRAQGQRTEGWYEEWLGKFTWSKAGDWMSKARNHDSKVKAVKDLEADLAAIESGAIDKEIIKLVAEIEEKQKAKRGTKTDEKKLDVLMEKNAATIKEQLKQAKEEAYLARFSDTAIKYVYEKVAEVLTGSSHDVVSQATLWGEEHEAEALEKLEKLEGVEVERVGFIQYNDHSGGSADGLIGNDCIVEVKCPYNPANHVKSILTGLPYSSDHEWQIQGNLLSTGRSCCYYVTYDPRVNEPELQLNVIKIERNEELIKAIQERLKEVKELFDNLMIKVNANRINQNTDKE